MPEIEIVSYRRGVLDASPRPQRATDIPRRRTRRSRSHPDALVASLLFAGLFLVYVAVSRHKFVAYDATCMVAVSKNLVDHFTLRTTGAFDDYYHLCTPYSPYGVGVSVLAAPVYALSKTTGHEMLLLSLINPVIVAATGVVVYAIGRALGWSASLAVLAALTFGVLTMALQATTELFSEPAVGLCIALMVWAALRWRDGWRHAPLVLGLSSAAVIQFRADSILTAWIGLVALPMFVPWRQILSRRNVMALGLPVAISVAFLLWYNDLRWGKLLVFSYNGQGFSTPMGRGIEGLLISPGKGVFIFNPVAVLGVIGIGILLWRNRPVGVMFILLIVARVLFFAKWTAWDGGVDWGSRFMFPVVFCFVIGAVEVLHVTEAGSALGILARATFTVLALLSVGISFLSIRVPYEQWWQTVSSPTLRAPFDRGGLLLPHPSSVDAVENALNFTERGSQIQGNFDLLEKGEALMAPESFQGKDPIKGWIVLLAGVGLLAAAGGLSRELGRDTDPHGTSGRQRVARHVRSDPSALDTGVEGSPGLARPPP
ncbi:MAG: hypothetical protein ACLPVF_01560 [Acidimicrobiales bacterium]